MTIDEISKEVKAEFDLAQDLAEVGRVNPCPTMDQQETIMYSVGKPTELSIYVPKQDKINYR